MTRQHRFAALATAVIAIPLTLLAQHPVGPADLALNSVHSQAPVWRVTPLTNLMAKQITLPLSFEANNGQFDSRVRFIARGQAYTLFITPAESVLVLNRRSSPRVGTAESQPQPAPTEETPAVVRLKLIGGGPPEIRAKGELRGKSNYFLGNNPDKWRVGVPNYASVRLHGVYPGIDLVYHGDRQHLEYDFAVSPGGDPRKIRVDFQGIDSAQVNTAGELILHVGDRELRWEKPVAYQGKKWDRHSIDCRYQVRGKRVSFELGNYDPKEALLIDPVLLYSTYLGGSGVDGVDGIAVDAAHNIYFTAGTTSSNFPTVPSDGSSFAGGQDIVVGKINPSGTALIYSTYLGGSGFEDSLGMAVDRSGNVYLGAMTNSPNFPTTTGAYQSALGGGTCDTIDCTDAALVEISSTGSVLLYSTYFGGDNDDRGTTVKLDSAGHAYLSGYTRSANFPVTEGAYQTSFGGGTCGGEPGYPCADAFVAKFDTTASGTASLIFSTYLGGNGDDNSLVFNGAPNSGLAVDGAGNAYLGGQTSSTNFPVTEGAYQASYGGGRSDAYVSVLDPTGSKLLYSTYLGGSGPDAGRGVALDALGHVYASGWTFSSNFPTTPGSYQTSFTAQEGFVNAWVAKLDTTRSGSASLLYSTFIGGPADVEGEAIAVDAAGNAFLTGIVDTSNLPLVTPVQPSYGGPPEDGFVSELDSTGSTLVFSTYLGGNDDDFGGHITVDDASTIYVTGVTSSLNFHTTSGALQSAYGGGGSDGFITKIGPATVTLTLPPGSNVSAVAVFPPGGQPTDANATSAKFTVNQVINPVTLTVTAFEVPTTEANGICEVGQNFASDFDCRLTPTFTFFTDNSGNQYVPQCVQTPANADGTGPSHCTFYRVTTSAVAGVDYVGPVYEYIAGNPGVPPPPTDTTVWDASNLQMYDDPNVPANLLFNADITTYSNYDNCGGASCVGADYGTGGKTKNFNDFVLAFPALSGTANNQFSWVQPLSATGDPVFAQATASNDQSLMIRFQLTNHGTPVINAVTGSNDVGVAILSGTCSSAGGVRQPIVNPGTWPTAVTYNAKKQWYQFNVLTLFPSGQYKVLVNSNLFHEQCANFRVK